MYYITMIINYMKPLTVIIRIYINQPIIDNIFRTTIHFLFTSKQ